MSKPKHYKTKILHGEEHHSLWQYASLIGGILLLIRGLMLLSEIIIGVLFTIFGLVLLHSFWDSKK